MIAPIPQKQMTVTLSEWDNCELTMLIYNNQGYFVLRQLCAIVGVSGVTRQAEILQSREDMQPYIIALATTTTKGPRDTWCLNLDGVGGWLYIVSEQRIRKEFRPNLVKFRRDVTRAARLILAKELQFSESGELQLLSQQTQRILQLEATTESLQQFALLLEQQLGAVQEKIRMLESDDE